MAEVNFDFHTMEPRRNFHSLHSIQEQMLAATDRIKAKIVRKDSTCNELKIELYEEAIREQRQLIVRANKTSKKLCQEKKGKAINRKAVPPKP